MALRLYDTLTREKRDFVPGDPERVTMYVCGPTVYACAHIGNARPPVVFDVLFRLLRRIYGDAHVVYARNFTDVDDKIIAAARDADADIAEITDRYARIYLEDMRALGVTDPTLSPTATGHIAEMISVIERLIEAGNAYAAEGHVLFSVADFDDYGNLSRRDRDDMIAGARVEVAPYKKDPADFVLWKPALAKEPGWDSPWGRGRPGWHLECSAMIEKNLGDTIDIHGGGVDLVFPHHENEIAQSRCVHGGAPLARYWLHNGFLEMNAEKMSKSLGNVRLARDLLAEHRGEALRLAILSGHYRQPLNFTDRLLAQSKATLDGWYRALGKLGDVEAATDVAAPAAVIAALEDDLNTPEALAAVSALANDANKASDGAEKARLKAEFQAAGALLGVLQEDPDSWFQDGGAEDLSADAVEARLKAREDARAAKDFATADKIRDDLAAAGVVIEDGPGGSTWRRG